MKKVALIFCLLLACCNFHIPGSEYQFSSDAFDTSEKCPHICWLGISPSITTSEDVYRLLRASNQINQKKFHIEDSEYISTSWYYENTKSLATDVVIKFKDDVVQSITIGSMPPFKIGDLMSLFGNPDKIDIRVVEEPDAVLVPYGMYYSSRKLHVWSEVLEQTDPSPNNVIGGLSLNVEADSKYVQPWLGFGHLRDYLAGQTMPQFPLSRPAAP